MTEWFHITKYWEKETGRYIFRPANVKHNNIRSCCYLGTTELVRTERSRDFSVKMNILPQISFLFSLLPSRPSLNYFKDSHSMLSTFMWSGRWPWTHLKALHWPKLRGGLTVPNFLCGDHPCFSTLLVMTGYKLIWWHIYHPQCLCSLQD